MSIKKKAPKKSGRVRQDEFGYVLIFDSGARIVSQEGTTIDQIVGDSALKAAKKRGQCRVRDGWLYWRR